MDLGPAGEARKHLKPHGLPGGIPFDIPQRQRAWAHHAHVAQNHTHQLRQFIEARAAEEFSKSREPLGVGKQCASAAAGIGHRAKFDEPDRPAKPAGPDVGIEDRAAEEEPHGQPDEQDQRQQEHKQRRGGEDVAVAFDEA